MLDIFSDQSSVFINKLIYLHVKQSTYYLARFNWRRKMLSVNGKSHVVRHVMTSWFLGISKSCTFGETLKMCLIDSTP